MQTTTTSSIRTDKAPSPFSIRRATADDKSKILDVMRELLELDERDLVRRHEWLYEECPHGRAMSWIATDDASGEVAGCTSFFPRKLWVSGRIALGALGGDGFVRPKFRRRGIMQAMHARSRQEMPSLGIDVMYGTPMPANFTPLKVAGSRDVTRVARYVRPLSARSFHIPGLAADRLFRAILVPRSRAYLDPATIRDTRINDVWARARGDIGITTVRDADYFTWRYVTSPSQKQHAFVILDGSEAIASCALEREADQVRVIDLVASRRHFGAALRAIASYASGCVSLEMRMTFAMARELGMLRRGYILRDHEPRPLNIVLPPGEPGEATFYDGARWYITWTDTDRDST